MLKRNFLVSANNNAWIHGAKKIFAADPYILHVLEKDNLLSNYDDVLSVSRNDSSNVEFTKDHDFVDKKHELYINILIKRLTELHGVQFNKRFWKKSLSLSILRHVSFCYELFKVCEEYLDINIHDCRILNEKSYYIPVDFDDHRRIFQSTDFGQEQLFSIYCNLFYPDIFKSWEDDAPLASVNNEEAGLERKSLWKRITLKGIARRLLNTRSPTLGILNSFFSADNLNKLFFRSLGKVQIISMPEFVIKDSEPQWETRKKLFRNELGFDRFDRFVFASLYYAMPKAFVENFEYIFNVLNVHFLQYKKLKWVVSEAWIGNTYSSIALAVLRKNGIKHINNEHNYIAYPFLGNNLKYIFPLVDEFASIGWKNKSVSNFLSKGSLFQWIEGECDNKKYDLLFISSIPNARAPEINASYGESGARVVPGYLQMNMRFFEALSDSTLGTMLYRSYPERYAKHALAWDQAYALRNYLSKVKYIDNSTTPARVLMQQSGLTVINYLSTSYIEALIANVPTVVLLNRDAYLLEESHEEFFKDLIEAKIFHPDPVEAAHFVQDNINDPEIWWRSSIVQKARTKFLKSNIGSPELLISHLIDHASVA
jgi:putative transferase (TIGR04331 family)